MSRVAVIPASKPARPQIVELLDPAWRRFVADHPGALAYHDPEWARLIADCYGFEAAVAVLSDAEGNIRAGLPFAEVGRPLGKKRWISLPFSDSCPPLLSSPDDMSRMLASIRSLAEDAGVAHVEIRGEILGAYTYTDAVEHVLPLERDGNRVFARFHRSQVQRNIRRAEREGVRVRPARSASDLTEVFYRLHVGTRRRLGVPVQPKRFFQLMWERMLETGRGVCLIASAEQTPIAAAVFLSSSATMTYKYGASNAEYWSLRPNHAIFWRAIEEACMQGFQRFDFGRTDFEDRGLRDFKSSWGAAERQLVYSLAGSDVAPHRQRGGRAESLLVPVIRRCPEWFCRSVGSLFYRYAT